MNGMYLLYLQPLFFFFFVFRNGCVEAGCVITPDTNGLVTIPNNWTAIEDNSFNGCLALKTLIFESPSKVTHIGYKSFFNVSLSAQYT